MSIDFNPEFKRAIDLMENTRHNIFITGKAGTGKSTLLTCFRSSTKKKVAVLAPTGVAAVNVQGQTIHSFFKFKPNVTLQSIKKKNTSDGKSIYKELDAIVIDEISMVRADLLDCVDRFLRLNGKNPRAPFGGLQMIFIGDLYQLPPVVTSQEREIFQSHYKSPYFFSSKFFDTFDIKLIELKTIYRQKDSAFVDLLNAIRNAAVTYDDICLLNKRVRTDFEPEAKDYYIYLTPLNARASAINDEKLSQLQGKPYTFEARIDGTFGRESYPTAASLSLKVGSQVMLVNNDQKGRWINGTMGKVIKIADDDATGVLVRLDDSQEVEVLPYKWEIHQFYLSDGMIQTKSMGSYTQYPLALAWALTIHKSQGKTFSKVIFDIGRGAFSSGQVYVALSRCTSLDGLVLKKPIYKKDIWTDNEVFKFIEKFRDQESGGPLFARADASK